MRTDRYIGIPFAERGRGWEGCDCWGLVRLVYQHERGISLPSYLEDDYEIRDGETVARLMNRHRADGWRPVAPGEERALDVILMRMLGLPCHVGLVIEPGTMLHVTRGINACVERYRGPLWLNRVIGIYRHATA